MVKRFLLISWLLASLFKVQAQTDSLTTDEVDENDETFSLYKPGPEGTWKLGVKMNLNFSSLFGSEMKSQKLLTGIGGGAYGRWNPNKKFALQAEGLIGFRGSNFNHGANGEYTTIKMLYADFPFIGFLKFGNEGVHQVGIGIQYSRLLNSSMYFKGGSSYGSKKPEFSADDWLPLLAYQYKTNWVSFQIAAKYGLKNINLGKSWPENGIPLNSGGEIRNFTTEFSLMF
ncbi:MAG: hypothetical protein L6Q78_01650 [Bacteroidia bacterium]|nr:hypothetical protein [Bacteroidia bacterium]